MSSSKVLKEAVNSQTPAILRERFRKAGKRGGPRCIDETSAAAFSLARIEVGSGCYVFELRCSRSNTIAAILATQKSKAHALATESHRLNEYVCISSKVSPANMTAWRTFASRETSKAMPRWILPTTENSKRGRRTERQSSKQRSSRRNDPSPTIDIYFFSDIFPLASAIR